MTGAPDHRSDVDRPSARARVAGWAGPARRAARRALGVPGGEQYDSEVETLRTELEALRAAVTGDLARLQRELRDQAAVTAEARDLLRRVERDLHGLAEQEWAAGDHVADVIASLVPRVSALGEMVDNLARRVDGLAADGERATDEATSPVFLARPGMLTVTGPDGRETLGFDAPTELQGAFGDVFRGDEEFIRSRLEQYLPYFGAGEDAADLGAGRGEMLSLLAAKGVRAVGIDTDEELVARIRGKGLDAEVADALGWLAGRPEASLDVVFSAHLVEHLGASDLVRLLGAARRALRPGGRFVAETPNPYSPPARRAFWVDPTHVAPVYPETLLVLLAQAGFERAYVRYPYTDAPPDEARRTAGEYAVIAYAGAASGTRGRGGSVR